MTGCQVIGAQRQGVVQQVIEANIAIAGQTGVGSDAAGVALDKGIDHPLTEDLLHVEQVEGDVQMRGNPAGVVRGCERTTAVLAPLARFQLRP